jgi:F-type H+-transporting ATPase subunit gamma
MASMRDIKRRRSSVSSIQQITKAMKLVSTVKLQHAKAAAEQSKAYFRYMYQTVQSMILRTAHLEHPYVKPNEQGKKAVIVITSNRGLAGGYNSNVVKLITGQTANALSDWDPAQLQIYSAGSKGRDALQRRGYEIAADVSDLLEDTTYHKARKFCQDLLKEVTEGKISEIYIAYTVFQNTVSHIPTLMKLLPIEKASDDELEQNSESGTSKGMPSALMNFEPHDEEALNAIIPAYLAGLVYGAFMEASASENGARMQAMDSATGNAEEMIEDLALLYNRARQSSITQELTEIIAGAEAIS